MTSVIEFLLTWAAILSVAFGIHSILSITLGAAYRAVNRIHAGMFPEAHRRKRLGLASVNPHSGKRR